MFKRTKLWTSMNLVTFVGAVAISGCDNAGEAGHASNASAHAGNHSTAAAPYAGGKGDGEGEGVATANPEMSDLEYLTQIGLMRGHLFVGYSLYEQGHIGHAKTHMKHPKSELYANLIPAFEARKSRGFGDELDQLSNAVNAEKDLATVTQIYKQLETAILKAESQVGAQSSSASADLSLASALLKVAGEEYGIAVVDGKMQNAHEYQDALGFTHIAEVILSDTKVADPAEKAALKKAVSFITDLKPHWPGLIPPNELSTKASEIYGVASRVELLAMGLK